MYRPTARVLAVLELLQARSRMSGQELARRLEVDERTVRRYVATLQELGIPVEGERGRYGGYTLRRGYKLPPMMFTDEEALGLAVGLFAARRVGLAEVEPAVEGVLAKLERLMPEVLHERVKTLEETVTAVAIRPAALSAGRVIFTLGTAVREKKQVWLRYGACPSEETERTIDPYAVIQREGYWYAFGYCHLREGLRLFRLDRVLEVEPLEKKFDRPKEFESPERILEAIAVVDDDRWTVEVLLETTLEDAHVQIPALGVALTEEPDGVMLRATTSDLDWISHVLAGLYCNFVVREPPELKDALKRRADEIARMAERT